MVALNLMKPGGIRFLNSVSAPVVVLRPVIVPVCEM